MPTRTILMRAIRQSMGLSQAQLSQLVGTNPSTISNIENGGIKPPKHIVRALEQRLGAPIDELLQPVSDIRYSII